MNITERNISDIIPYENNPRNNKNAIEKVAESIKEFGFKVPIIVDKGGIIVAGHTRLEAAKLLGLKKVPVIVADDLTPEQVKAFRLADNKVAEFSTWDFKKLNEELSELGSAFNFEGFGFYDFDFLPPEEQESADVKDDDFNFEEELPIEPVSKIGDIWQLGRHRLMCGDSTNKETVELLMNGNKADMVFTDPPYGMKKEAYGVLNDNLNYDDLLEFNKKWIPLTFANTKENGSWYCWGIDEPLMDIYSNILKPMQKENKITFRNLITWDKGNGQGQLSEDFRMYPIADEKCLFVMMGVQGFSNNADNYFEAWEPIRTYLKQERDRMGWSNADMKKMCGHSPTSGCHWFDKSQWMMPTEEEYKTWQENAKGEGFKKEYEGFKKEYEEIKKEYYSTRAYFDNTHDNMNNVWHFNRASASERELTGGHATPKPIALCSRAIKSSCRKNESVLDVFGGSGSTLIACEQLDRTCYMMELDPKYCDVIIKRWETLTGKKAVKI